MEGQAGEPDRGGLTPRDPSRLRVSDEDRHAVAEVLRHAAGEGRLDLDELDERLEATYAAKTYGDLVPLTADLPASPTAKPAVPPALRRPSVPVGATYTSSVAIMGDCARRGAWHVPEKHQAVALMGGVTLDLREAHFESGEITIDAFALMGGIDVIVNAATQVIVEGYGVMGEFSEARSKVALQLTVDSPVVRLRGLALMGGVRVKRQPMPGDQPRLLRRR